MIKYRELTVDDWSVLWIWDDAPESEENYWDDYISHNNLKYNVNIFVHPSRCGCLENHWEHIEEHDLICLTIFRGSNKPVVIPADRIDRLCGALDEIGEHAPNNQL